MASSPEPVPGLGAFIVVNGAENQCRPEGIRNFFKDRVGACRIVTSSRSYSNEKTFVTLEFMNHDQVVDAISRFNGYRINGCHTNVSFFKSRRSGQGGGDNARSRHRLQGQGAGNGSGWNNQGNFQGHQRRGRSFGDMHGERMRGMSPNAAARFIERRLDEKERRQGGYHGDLETDHHSHSYSRSRSRSRSRSWSRSRSRSRSPRSYRSASSYRRSRSVSRSPARSGTPSSEGKLSQSQARSVSLSRRSPTPDLIVRESVMSGDEEHLVRHQSEDSEVHSHRRRKKGHRRRKYHSPPVPEEASDPEGRDAAAVADTAACVGDSENAVLKLDVPSSGLSAATQKLLSAKRESLEEEFKTDVSTIVSVTKLLMSQDMRLQSGLEAALKGCIRDISLRYIEDFQAFTKANAQH